MVSSDLKLHSRTLVPRRAERGLRMSTASGKPPPTLYHRGAGLLIQDQRPLGAVRQVRGLGPQQLPNVDKYPADYASQGNPNNSNSRYPSGR
jgi:hypothetical protein